MRSNCPSLFLATLHVQPGSHPMSSTRTDLLRIVLTLGLAGTSACSHPQPVVARDGEAERQAFIDSIRSATDAIVTANIAANGPYPDTGAKNSNQPEASPVPEQPWYSGGTLHQATMREWKAASPANRLATAADFATNTLHPSTTEEVRAPAREMMECVDRASTSAPDGKTVAEVGAVCAVLMGW
jgi:hypothetical protein